jgi:hypothetical protein
MTKNQDIKYVLYGILFLIIYLATINIIYSMFTQNNDQIGFLGVIIGGTVTGFFTIFGVILTLNYQQIKQESEIKSHKKMLLTQLKFTHDFIANLPSKGSNSLFAGLLIYDHDWHTHTQYIDLDKNDFRTVVDWFYLMHQIEVEANKNFDGSIAADYVLKIFDVEKYMLNIENVIEKIV